MAGKNKVEQKVSLDASGYAEGHKKIRSEQDKTAREIKRSTKEQAKAYEENAEKIKKKNLEIGRSLKDISKEFGKNLWKGTVITAGGAMAATLKDQYSSAAKSILTLEQGLSRASSRFDLTSEKVKKLRKELQTLGAKTGVNGGLLAEGAEELMSANKGRSSSGIGDIGQFSAMGGGDPKEVARFVIDYLKGSGQDLTENNIKDLLTSVSASSRGGDLSLQDSLKALTVDPASKAKLNLSNRENAGLIAGASGVGQDRGISIAGLNAVLKKSVGGFGEGAALAGILGIKGGSFLKNGKFDVNKLGEASQNMNKQGLGKADFTKLLEASGISGSEAEGLYSILKDFDKFNASFKKVIGDQKTLEQSFSDSTDNIKDAFSRMGERIAKGTTEILSPIGEVGKELLDGNLMNALKKTPGSAADSAQGVWDNKAVVAIGIGATALTGALASKISGILGFGNAKDTAKGLAVQAATGGKVQPVMVVNISDLVKAMEGNKISSVAETGAAGMGVGMTAATVGGVATVLAATYGVGVIGKEVLETTHAERVDRYGIDTPNGFRQMPKPSTSIDPSAPSFENAVSMMSQMISILKSNPKTQLEIVDNGERFTAKPKAGDSNRNNI